MLTVKSPKASLYLCFTLRDLTKIFTLEVLETGCTTLSVYDQLVPLKMVKMGTCNMYFITIKDL